MTLEQLLARTRILADDIVTGGAELWTDEFLTEGLNLGEQEACIRGHLIQEIEGARCEVELVDDQRTYALDPLVLDVLGARLRTQDCDLERVAIESVRFSNKRGGPPAAFALMNDGSATTGKTLVLDRAAPPLDTQDTIDLHISRLPLTPMSAPNHVPEIGVVHHDALCYWALHLAFLVRDTDAEDPQRAADMEARFAARFGIREDANVARKQQRHRVPVVRMRYP
ncbi:MAG: hypothetical protein AB7V08_13840 [Elusimicrobiales bacterium]